MIYALYWKDRNERHCSNQTPLLFTTKKGGESYIKSKGTNHLIVKPYKSRALYKLVSKDDGEIYFSTFEKEIAEEENFLARNGVTSPSPFKLRKYYPKTIYALTKKDGDIISIDMAFESRFLLEKAMQRFYVGKYYKIIKIK